MNKFNPLELIGKWSKQYANLPDRYIARRMRRIFWQTPLGKVQYLPRTVEKKKFFISLVRPWSTDYKLQCEMTQGNKMSVPVTIEPIRKWSFFRGDLVEILTGKDKGKQGKVIKIIEERNWVIVEGLNMKLRRETAGKSGSSKWMQSEQPLLVTTQVRLVDPHDMKPTDIEWRYTEKGEEVRISCRSGKIIPLPATRYETIDYKYPGGYAEQPKDTKKIQMNATFTPVLKTFEMDIMDKMGIKEDRIPKKTYWY